MICTEIRPSAGPDARRKAQVPCRTVFGVIGARLKAMIDVARQRRQLALLSDWQLKDIGLTRADVAREVERPFWQI